MTFLKGGRFHVLLEQLFLLNGKHAVVTGAASGLGRQCALTLARAGARVTLIDLNKTGLSETAKGIQGAAGSVLELEIDVTQSRPIMRGIAQATEAF